MTEDLRICVCTVEGEASGSSLAAARGIASSIMNRVGRLEWHKLTTPRAVIERSGFDAFKFKNTPYRFAMEAFEGKRPLSARLRALEDAVRAIFEGLEPPTCPAVLYFSPRAQAALHVKNPERWPAAPAWDFSLLEEVFPPGILPTDDFRFFKYRGGPRMIGAALNHQTSAGCFRHFRAGRIPAPQQKEEHGSDRRTDREGDPGQGPERPAPESGAYRRADRRGGLPPVPRDRGHRLLPQAAERVHADRQERPGLARELQRGVGPQDRPRRCSRADLAPGRLPAAGAPARRRHPGRVQPELIRFGQALRVRCSPVRPAVSRGGEGLAPSFFRRRGQ